MTGCSRSRRNVRPVRYAGGARHPRTGGTAIALLLAWLTLVAGVLPPQPVGAQDFAAVVVQDDPRSSVVALSVRYPAGSASDPAGQEGTAFLLGRALETEISARLRPLAARVEVGVDRDELFVTLIAPPERWAEAFRAVEGILEGPSSLAAAVPELIERHRERLVFEEGAPVRSFERERLRMILGATHSGARPVAGSEASVAGLTPEGLARFHAEHLRRSAATVAVVGPVSAAEAGALVPGPLREVSPVSPFREPPAPVAAGAQAAASPPGGSTSHDSAPDTLSAPPELPPPPRLRLRDASAEAVEVPPGSLGAPWSSGDRVAIDRQLTSTWMAVAWPYPTGTPRILLEFLAVTLREAIVSSPPDPGFYSADVGIERLDDGPVLVFSATVDPRVAARWEEKILEGMRSVASSPPAGAFFALGRRRFRNSLLLPLGAPEERSRWLARELAVAGRIPDPEGELWRITRDALGAAAGAAGPPRVLLLGPLDMMEAHRP